jgi:hypothetical protein
MTATRTFLLTITETTPCATPHAPTAGAGTPQQPHAAAARAKPCMIASRAAFVLAAWEALNDLIGQTVGGLPAVPLGAVRDALWASEQPPADSGNKVKMFARAYGRAGLSRVELENAFYLVKLTVSAGGLS